MPASHQPFVLRITSKGRNPLLIGLLASGIISGILLVIFKIEGIGVTWFNYTRTAYFTFTIGYLIFISRIIQRSHQRGFDKLLRLSSLNEEEKAQYQTEFEDQRIRKVEYLVYLAIGISHAYFGVINRVITGEIDLPIYSTWRGIQIVILWFIISQAASTYMRNMTRMNKLSRHVPIDLLNLDQLMPLTSSGIVSILAFIGAYSLLFIQGVDLTDVTNPAILVLVPSIAYMIITPLKGVRKRIVKAKENEISLIERAIDGDREALKESRLKNNLDNINVIDLITYKKQIQTTFEIPINIPTASRFLFYLIIPLLTWIAASMVDKVIDFLLK